MLFNIWRFTHTEEIPKGTVKLVFQLQNSLSKDQHLAKVTCQGSMFNVHDKHDTQLFLFTSVTWDYKGKYVIKIKSSR